VAVIQAPSYLDKKMPEHVNLYMLRFALIDEPTSNKLQYNFNANFKPTSI
jgi:hypothetical protein